MEKGQYIRTLAEFITGDIELIEFKQLIEDRLIELRQEPEMTDEKGFLSTIELYLHEAEEGLRDQAELYVVVQFILDNILLTRFKYFSRTSSKLPYVRSTTSDGKNAKNEDLTLAVR